LRKLRAERPDIVHLQYPTHGFRRSLVPHLLHLGMFGWPRLTTLHDSDSAEFVGIVFHDRQASCRDGCP
jgi:hypothetical protein